MFVILEDISGFVSKNLMYTQETDHAARLTGCDIVCDLWLSSYSFYPLDSVTHCVLAGNTDMHMHTGQGFFTQDCFLKTHVIIYKLLFYVYTELSDTKHLINFNFINNKNVIIISKWNCFQVYLTNLCPTHRGKGIGFCHARGRQVIALSKHT